MFSTQLISGMLKVEYAIAFKAHYQSSLELKLKQTNLFKFRLQFGQQWKLILLSKINV